MEQREDLDPKWTRGGVKASPEREGVLGSLWSLEVFYSGSKV